MEDSRIDGLIEQVRKLTIKVTSLEEELRRRGNPSPPSSTRQPTNVGAQFAIGDRVRVLNRFKKPAAWDNRKDWSEDEAKIATVTEVLRATQIFIVTDNGVETWRAPNNLELLH